MTKAFALAACLVLTLSACASGPPDRGGPRGPGGGPPGGGPPGGIAREQLFISPAGEPYRAPLGAPHPIGAWWTRLDASGAGQVGEAGLVADFERFFALADTDHDGVIDGFEVNTYERDTVPEIVRAVGRGGLQGAAAYGLLNDPQPIRSADFNLDGRVTLPEYQRKARELFVRLDKNRDGRLARGELPEAKAAPGGPGAGPGGRGPRGGGPPGGGRRPR